MADGVAYAPHLPIDVKAWGVDWYGFSVYKTWGPHMAALYGSHSAFQDIKVLLTAYLSRLSIMQLNATSCIGSCCMLYPGHNIIIITITTNAC